MSRERFRVGTALLDGIATKPPEIPCVGAHQASPMARGEGELLCVAEPGLTQFMGADRVHATLSEPDSDDRREVLIEVELHARRAIASCIARPSSWAPMSSAISASISCGNLS